MSATIAHAADPSRPASRSPSSGLSPARVAGATVLAAWATLFWFLLLSGREALYLSSRTDWVVPMAAVLLTLASIGRLASARVRAPAPIGRREAWAMGLMVVPVVVLLALPPGTLGQFSASKRSSFAGSGIATPVGDISTGALSMIDVAAAQTSKEGQQAIERRAGSTVDFVGFVTRYGDTPATEFLLTRYIITCCVADATIAQVRVVNVTPGEFSSNDWVRVQGTIYPVGREVIVEASEIDEVPQPSRPYLTP